MVKRVLMIFMVSILVISICGCGNSVENSVVSEPVSVSSQSQSEPETSKESSSSAIESKASSSSSSSSNDQYSMETVISLIESGLTGYDGYDVFYEDGVIIVNIWMNGLADAVSSVQAGLIDKKLWIDTRESIRSMSSSCRVLVDTAGKKDVDIMTNLLNDKNLDNVILSIVNDTIFYDATED